MIDKFELYQTCANKKKLYSKVVIVVIKLTSLRTSKMALFDFFVYLGYENLGEDSGVLVIKL